MIHHPPSRITIIAPNWLGDAVMSLPLIGMLRRAKRVRLSVMCPPYTARVYAGIGGIDELIVFSKQGLSRGLLRRSRILRRLRPRAVIVLPPSFSSALSAAAAGIPLRFGYATDGRRPLLNRALPAGRLREEHLSRSYTRLGAHALACIGASHDGAGNIAADGEESPGDTTNGAHRDEETAALTVFPAERASLAAKLGEMGAPLEGFCLVVPGATYGNAKTWPEESFREAAQLIARTMPVVLAGGAAEREVCAGIASGSEEIHNMSGETSLGEFFALVEAAGVLVANDSGAAHVAGSLATPGVIIFGSTSPRWTAPPGGRTTIVRKQTLCSPCFLKNCPTNLECFAGIHPEHIADQALCLAGKNPAKKGVDILPGGR
jgi:heptosyltransferase-2